MYSLVNLDGHAQPSLPVSTGKNTFNTIAQDELPEKRKQTCFFICINCQESIRNTLHVYETFLYCVIKGSEFRKDDLVSISG